MTADSERQRGPVMPGASAMSIVVVLVMLLAAVALTARQTPPPAIAEFAPQAVEQIKDAPINQSSDYGSGPGGGGGAATTTTSPDGSPPTTERVIEVARVRRCVGEPPRQIEDPQSPPCVPYWDGDNGGATAKGVTEDEIRIAVPNNHGDLPAIYETFFNSRFEFYGRKLRLITYPAANTCDPAGQQADAVKVDKQIDAFASSWWLACFGWYYGQELARRGIIYATQDPNYDDAYLNAYRPYLWQYSMADDRLFSATGAWACQTLANRNARFTNDPKLLGKPRQFAVILRRPSGVSEKVPSMAPLVDRLKACGANPVYTTDDTSDFEETNVALQLLQSGATTVICMCEWSDYTALSKGATGEGYFPEWVLGTFNALDTNYYIATFGNKEQNQNAFGLTFRPRQNQPQNEPSFWAQNEVRPTGGQTQDTGARMGSNDLYRNLLLLASGIQMAGPNLTPETFERALQTTAFPNPDTPIKAGKVGFQPSSHSMTIDAAEWWWSNTGVSPYDDKGQGTLCYVNGGARHAGNDWTAGDDRFFSGACDSGG